MKSNRMRRIGYAVAVAAAALATVTVIGTVATAAAAQPETATHAMHTAQAKGKPAGGGLLAYKGGQVTVSPRVYLIYWGSQWGSAGSTGLPTSDPAGEAPLQKSFLGSLHGSGDTWSTSTTQYCEGVATGTTQCGSSGTHVGHPSSSVVAGSWVDNASAAPGTPSSSQIGAEAAKAAAHFNDYSNGVQYIIDTPSGVVPQGFKTSYCAWHDGESTPGGNIAYTNMPYVSDAGASCGAGFVPTGTSGVKSATEGVTIVGGHEYAETLSDQWPSIKIAWTDGSGAENGDKCAWISSGQGASAIVGINGSNYAVQSLWSNNFNNNAGGCVNRYQSATNQG